MSPASQIEGQIRLGCIGTDSSHLPEFTRRINALHAAGRTRCRVTQFWTDGHADMPADQVRKWETDTLNMDVRRAADLKSMLDTVDGVLVLAVNGHRHLKLALPAIERGLPTYIDKPLTCDFDQARQLLAAVRQSGGRCYSASSLRFAREVTGFDRSSLGDIVAVDAFGPGELNPSMEGLFFYGVHTIEMVDALFGQGGVVKVRAVSDAARDRVDLVYADGRSAHLRMERLGSYDFGGTVHGTKACYQFKVDFTGVYDRLIEGMTGFFESGAAPATLEAIVENIAVMAAGNASIRDGGRWVDVPTVD